MKLRKATIALGLVGLIALSGCNETKESKTTQASKTTEATTEETKQTTEEITESTTEATTKEIEIDFTSTPDSLESEEELIAFLTTRKDEIGDIVNNKEITELPIEVKDSLKETIDFIWYNESLAGFTYNSLTNETKTKVLDLYLEMKELAKGKDSSYSSDYNAHYIKTSSDIQKKYELIKEAIEKEKEETTEAKTTEASTSTQTTEAPKPQPQPTTQAPATEVPNTEWTPEIDDYPSPNGNFTGSTLQYDANGNPIYQYDDGYYVYDWSESTQRYYFGDKRNL